MAIELSRHLAETIEREVPNLRALSDERASLPRAPGKWSAKEELGHLIDSAANNHLRFVGGALAEQFCGPRYAQDAWVRLHGYGTMHWHAIVDFWLAYNSFLTGLVEKIPEARLGTECLIGDNPPVTLGFLVEDYVLHMQHHIDLLLQRRIVTPYPRLAM